MYVFMCGFCNVRIQVCEYMCFVICGCVLSCGFCDVWM